MMSADPIEHRYMQRTPRSREAMQRATAVMPGGNTRSLVHHEPYPLAFDRGSGPYLWDLDGNRYTDLFFNGLSLIHGHAYPPVVEAIRSALDRGQAWAGSSSEQIEFAEMLCRRIAAVERVRFVNTGTEAGMLAAKIARTVTGRPALLKAWHGYHGSYDDLEVGLYGQGDIPDRAVLADFGDAESFVRVLEKHGDQIAAVVLEPMQYTGVVTPPPDGFLESVQRATRRAGALFVLDDCLMFRLAPGGSAERYHLQPDLTILGKFIGGGVPVGVVGGSEEHLSVLDPRAEGHIYHGGSFNGHLMGCVAGMVALEELTSERIARMEEQANRLRGEIATMAAEFEVPCITTGEGSVFGLYLSSSAPGQGDGSGNPALTHLFELATRNHGLAMGTGGEVAMATVITDEVLEETIGQFRRAFADTAASMVELGLEVTP